MSIESEIQHLIATVILEQIRLVEVNGMTTIASPAELGQAELNIDGHTDARRDNGSVIVLATLVTKLYPQAQPGDTKLAVRCVLELRYKLPSGLEPSQETLNEFARTNGLFNAWPYCRELVQSTAARMALPPVTIPLLRVGKVEQGSSEQKRSE